jgi:hypothetical protein
MCSLCVPSPNDSMHNTPISLHIMHTMRRRAGETFSPGIRLISIGYKFDCLVGNKNGVQGAGSSNLLIPTKQYQGFPVNSRNPFFVDFSVCPTIVQLIILTEEIKKPHRKGRVNMYTVHLDTSGTIHDFQWIAAIESLLFNNMLHRFHFWGRL